MSSSSSKAVGRNVGFAGVNWGRGNVDFSESNNGGPFSEEPRELQPRHHVMAVQLPLFSRGIEVPPFTPSHRLLP
jgi:hypothetical protein